MKWMKSVLTLLRNQIHNHEGRSANQLFHEINSRRLKLFPEYRRVYFIQQFNSSLNVATLANWEIQRFEWNEKVFVYSAARAFFSDTDPENDLSLFAQAFGFQFLHKDKL